MPDPRYYKLSDKYKREEKRKTKTEALQCFLDMAGECIECSTGLRVWEWDGTGNAEKEANKQRDRWYWYNSAVKSAVKLWGKYSDCSEPPTNNPDPLNGLEELKKWAIKELRKAGDNAGQEADLASIKQNGEKTISQIIEQGEGPTIEFKETLEYSVRESKQNTNLNKECLKTIAAFLNTNGGTLLIGVKDNGEITGIDRDLPYVQRKNEDGFQLKLRDLIKSNFTPFPAGKINIRFEKLTKGTVCRVDIEPVNKNQIINLGKDVYIRDGNTTRKLEGRILIDWIQQRGK